MTEANDDLSFLRDASNDDLRAEPTIRLLNVADGAETYLLKTYGVLFHRGPGKMPSLPRKRFTDNTMSVSDEPDLQQAQQDDKLVDALWRVQDVLAERLGVADKLSEQHDRFETIAKAQKGQQKAIDWLKAHEHSQDTGKPMREF